MTSPPSSTIRLSLAPHSPGSYDILVGSGILRAIGDRLASILSRRGHAFVISDDNLPDEPLDHILDSLTDAGFGIAEEVLSASESAKSVETVERLLTDIARTKHERHDPIIALGGGVIGDIAGFAAAVYRRGVPVVQCPTTLLAMVDASIGGKTGVNLPTPTGLRKNMVGAFWQPCLVIADVATLRSLPDRHLRAGLAECIKHALIAKTVGVEADLFPWTTERLPAFLARDEAALAELVRRNIAVKAAVVAADEREEDPDGTGGRALLNLGHTFAHAIETIPGLTAPDSAMGAASPGARDDDPESPAYDSPHLLHGEAVALGLCAAAAAARAMKLLKPADAEAIPAALTAAGLPTRIAGLPPDERILEAMSHDKKVSAGRLRLVLPTALGEARLIDSPPETAIRAALSAIRA